ncbi:MAG: 50S ribosomal protein L32, partial [Lachnospiraceae bacterium]|nr:50S ribosomal protein L32 [Lachnospiraceae bacterium]
VSWAASYVFMRPNCGELMMPHRVCKACGSYNKKKIITTAE